MISHRTSLANCDEAIRRAGDPGQLKVLVEAQ
jgi:hypothetical protein